MVHMIMRCVGSNDSKIHYCIINMILFFAISDDFSKPNAAVALQLADYEDACSRLKQKHVEIAQDSSCLTTPVCVCAYL